MNLSEILQQYRAGERGLPDYSECSALAAKIAKDYAYLCEKVEELTFKREALAALRNEQSDQHRACTAAAQ